MKNPMTRPWALVAAVAAAATLAGCETSKIADPAAGAPVETRAPAATAGGAGGANAGATPQSNVATVDLNRSAAGSAMLAAPTQRIVYFDFDSYSVKDEYRSLLEGHAKALAAARDKHVVVEGHTDERGGREYNLALGQKRAQAVAKSLSLLGVADNQVEAVSFGEERPAAPGHDEAAWAQNRRAELKDR